MAELQRVSGAPEVVPPTNVVSDFESKGMSNITSITKLCLDSTGAIVEQKMLKSSGYPDYDARIEAAIRDWRFKPYELDGEAIAVCTSATFIYKKR